MKNGDSWLQFQQFPVFVRNSSHNLHVSLLRVIYVSVLKELTCAFHGNDFFSLLLANKYLSIRIVRIIFSLQQKQLFLIDIFRCREESVCCSLSGRSLKAMTKMILKRETIFDNEYYAVLPRWLLIYILWKYKILLLIVIQRPNTEKKCKP